LYYIGFGCLIILYKYYIPNLVYFTIFIWPSFYL